MGTFTVIPIDPGEELKVERRQIGKEQILVIVSELVLHGAVKAFAVGIHFWGFRIGMPMGEGVAVELVSEVAFEFAAVIGEHGLDAIGKERFDELKELAGGKARVAARRPGESKVRVQVGESDDKAPAAIDLPFDGIEGHAVTWMTGDEMLGLARCLRARGLGSAVGPQPRWAMAHFVRCISDEAPNGAHRRTAQVLALAEGSQNRIYLLFGEVRMVLADASDLGNDRRCPLTMAAALRCRRGRGQGASSLPFRLPRKERATAHFKGIPSRRQTVDLPELKNLNAPLGVFMNHLPA